VGFTHVCPFLCVADWVDTKDPNVIAESELLQAAASIEAAAKKLSQLKPREKAVSMGRSPTSQVLSVVSVLSELVCCCVFISAC